MKIVTCKQCGKDFRPDHGNRELCSYECRHEHKKQKGREFYHTKQRTNTAWVEAQRVKRGERYRIRYAAEPEFREQKKEERRRWDRRSAAILRAVKQLGIINTVDLK